MLSIDSKIKVKYERYAELSEKFFRDSLSYDEAIELENLSGELDENEQPFYQTAIDRLENLLNKAR